MGGRGVSKRGAGVVQAIIVVVIVAAEITHAMREMKNGLRVDW